MREQFLWTEKYRPQKVADCILPDQYKKIFQQFVDQKNVPNLILAGGPGIGKTTVAASMLKELGCDYIIINASKDGNIDTLRYEIQQFASSMSIIGEGRKYVILDEADYLNANSTQPALRNFMEEYAANCGFILTCNLKNRIIEPLHSRCSVIDFKISKKEAAGLATQFLKRIEKILKEENVEYDKATVAAVITKYFPDWRRVLNELQSYSAIGKIDSGILSNLEETSINDLIKLVKEKNFTAIRKWVGENIDNDTAAVFRKFYDAASTLVTPASIPVLVLLLGRYQYQAAFSVDQEINLSAFLAEAMAECAWK
jgi:DNA polymerase III delta prime subunit